MEVANVNIKIILDHARETGIPVSEILKGVDTPESYFYKVSKRCSWDDYVKVLKNLSLHADAEDIARIGLKGAVDDGYGIITRIISGLFLRPIMLYWMQAKFTGKFLFKNMHYEYERINKGRVVLTMSAKGTPPPQLFWDGYREVYRNFPKLLGVGTPADVQMINNENTATFNIEIYNLPTLKEQVKQLFSILTSFRKTVLLLAKLQDNEGALLQAKNDLEKANKELAESKDVVETQLKIISHDVYNNLQIMSFYKRAVMKGNVKKVEKLEESFDRSVEIIQSVLTQSRYILSNGKFTPKDKVLLSKGVDLAISVHSKKVNSKGINIHKDIDECVVTFEKCLLGNSVIGNILSNAIKYTNSMDDIYITGRNEDNYAVLTIRDTGIGMSEKRLKHINETVSSLNSTNGTSDEIGSGLGIGIVRNILHAYGGEISFASKRGKGTTATIKLPLIMQLQTPRHMEVLDMLQD